MFSYSKDEASYFSDRLFSDISPTVAAYFETKSRHLFTDDDEDSYIDVNYIPNPTGADSPPRHWMQLKVSSCKGIESLDEISDSSHTLHFIRARHSHSRLSIKRQLFDSLLSRYQVFPKIKEFILSFGAKNGENEIGPPKLKFSPTIQQGRLNFEVFECAYGLRFVEWNGRGDYNWDGRGNYKTPFSVRQCAIYHKRYKSGASTWIIITTSESPGSCLKDYLINSSISQALNPFEPHALLVENALTNWRGYLIWLTEKTTEQTDRYIVASVSAKAASMRVKPTFEERQKIKVLEDYVLDLFVALDSSRDTINSLLEKYDEYKRNKDSYQQGEETVDLVRFALLEQCREIDLCRLKTESLLSKVKGAIQLLSSLLDLENGYALKELAEESSKDNDAMRMLTEKATQDAAAVKVLTVITLIYLPASAVSNFFSTQLIQSEDSPGQDAYYLVLAQNWWLFWAIAVPLTGVTLFIWWIWVQLQRGAQRIWKKKILDLANKLPQRQAKRPDTLSSDAEKNVSTLPVSTNDRAVYRLPSVRRRSEDIVEYEQDGQIYRIIE